MDGNCVMLMDLWWCLMIVVGSGLRIGGWETVADGYSRPRVGGRLWKAMAN